MGKRGPQKKNVTILEPSIKKRPQPLYGMTVNARTVWKRIVMAYPPDQFKPQHLGQLRMYCECEAINKIALSNAAKEDYENPYWLNLADKMAGRCQGLAVKLGITVNNTMAARGKGGKAVKPKSKIDDYLFGGSK